VGVVVVVVVAGGGVLLLLLLVHLATHLIFVFWWAPKNRHIGGVFAFF
jgi:hypothetical protein